MRRLILVRHSLPKIAPDVPAREWHLSEEGRRRCKPLAEALRPHRPGMVVTSVERKAIETGRLIAATLEEPCAVVEGLHEHDRHDERFLAQDKFEAQVARLFERPGDVVFGRESGDAAWQRFDRAVRKAVARYEDRNVALVTHGTVMTLFTARAAGLEPFPLWKRLGLPAFIVLSLPEMALIEIREQVE